MAVKKEEVRELTLDEFKKRVAKMSKDYYSLSKTQFVRSGSIVFDTLLGGGIPKGAFILLSSDSGIGKSTAALNISRTYCMQGLRVAYFDYEGGVNEQQVRSMGLEPYLYDENTNPDGLFYCYQTQTYRDAEVLLDNLMSKFDLVVIDSATEMLTEKVKGASAEDTLPGIDARVMGTFLKRYKAEARRRGTSWIIINQLRNKISFNGPTTAGEAGGNALKFAADVRLMMKKSAKGDLVREEETALGVQKVPFGALCTIWAEKNRFARPKIPLGLAVIFGKGISNEYAYYDFMVAHKAIRQAGSWFTVKFDSISEQLHGAAAVINWIGSHREEVKSYIASQGGYKLVATSSESLDLNEGVSELGDDQIFEGDFEQDDSDDEVMEDVGAGSEDGGFEADGFEGLGDE